jgi:hypothetical protein
LVQTFLAALLGFCFVWLLLSISWSWTNGPHQDSFIVSLPSGKEGQLIFNQSGSLSNTSTWELGTQYDDQQQALQRLKEANDEQAEGLLEIIGKTVESIFIAAGEGGGQSPCSTA